MKPSFRSIAYISIFLIILSGFQFGYQIGLTGPFLLFITEEFGFSLFQLSLISSFLILGALVGSMVAGPIADRIGRKKSLLGCCVIFLAASVITYMGSSAEQFYLGRFLSGVGVGAISLVSAMLLSEISPESIRGQVVSTNQLMITVGTLFAFLVGYITSNSHDWHSLILFSAIPVAIQVLFYSLIPESPAWHRTGNLFEKAEKTLLKLRKDILWKDEKPLVENKQEASPMKKGMKKALWIGILVNFFQQITGINAIIFFAPQIFKEAGFVGDSATLLASLSLGAVNIISTILAIMLIEKLGRKFLLLFGSAMMALALTGLSIVFVYQTPYMPVLSIIFFLLFCFSFSMSLGPVAWVLISEIFHPKSKGKAMGICLFVNWLTAYVVTLFFLDLSQIIGSNGVFALFGAFAIMAFFYFYKKLPETKGKTLAEIEEMIQSSSN